MIRAYDEFIGAINTAFDGVSEEWAREFISVDFNKGLWFFDDMNEGEIKVGDYIFGIGIDAEDVEVLIPLYEEYNVRALSEGYPSTIYFFADIVES